MQGRGNDFFLGGGGGKHVDMPSDCQNLGGGAQAYSSPSDKKLGGAIAPLAPRLPRPCVNVFTPPPLQEILYPRLCSTHPSSGQFSFQSVQILEI